MTHQQLCADSEVDALESRNAVLQFDEMRRLAHESLAQGSFALTSEIVLGLHECATRDIYTDAGRFRTGDVMIGGSQHTPPPQAS